MPRTGTKANGKAPDSKPSGQKNLGPTTPYQYEEAQTDEVEALKAIYDDAFTGVEAKSAWSNAPEISFTLKLSAYSENDVFVILYVTLTATYPKTLPMLRLEEGKGVSNKVKKQMQDIVQFKPREMLGEVMIHEVAASIQELLENVVTEETRKEIASAEVPSLENERATREAAASKLAAERRESIVRRDNEAKAEEDRKWQLRIDEELAKRERQRASLRAQPDQEDDDAYSATAPVINFDQAINYKSESANAFSFRKVWLTSLIEQRHELSSYVATPITESIASTVFTLQRVIVARHHVKSRILDLEQSLERLKTIRHSNLLNLVEFRVDHHEETWQFHILTEYSSQGSLGSLLGMMDDGLPTAKSRLIAIEILQGLGCLHRHEIVHRNLIADNIAVIVSGDGTMTVKIGNADIGKRIQSVAPSAYSTNVSPPWSAPELAASSDVSESRKSDIWV